MDDSNEETRSTLERDTILLESILALEIGTIANIIQAAVELDGSLYDRLSKGYYELTNTSGDPDTEIRLRDDEDPRD